MCLRPHRNRLLAAQQQPAPVTAPQLPVIQLVGVQKSFYDSRTKTKHPLFANRLDLTLDNHGEFHRPARTFGLRQEYGSQPDFRHVATR